MSAPVATVFDYQSKRHCPKTLVGVERPQRQFDYQSKRHCPKTTIASRTSPKTFDYQSKRHCPKTDWWDYDPTKCAAIIESPERSRAVRGKRDQNPQKFAVEFGAEFAETEGAFLSPKTIAAAFRPHPAIGDDRNHLRETGAVGVSYRAHADAGRTHDNFCLAMAHAESIDGVLHAYVDVMDTWQAHDYPSADGFDYQSKRHCTKTILGLSVSL